MTFDPIAASTDQVSTINLSQTNARVQKNVTTSTGIGEASPGTNLAKPTDSKIRKVSTTSVSSFGFNKKEAGAVEKLMTDFCSQVEELNVSENTKAKSSFLDNLRTLFAKIVDFFKGNDIEIEKHQAKGWKQFENFKALFKQKFEYILKEAILLPTFQTGSQGIKIALMKMFQDKPEIMSFLLSQPESKEIINRCYQEMGAVNFYNVFKDCILNNEMPWLDKGFYADPTLDQIKAQMTPAEKDKFLTAAYTITKKQFRKALENQQLGKVNFNEKDKETKAIEELFSFLKGGENIVKDSIQLFEDLKRNAQCSIVIDNVVITLLHSVKGKVVNEKDILSDLKQQVISKKLDENAIKKLSEFLIKTPSQGYLATTLPFGQDNPYTVISNPETYKFEVNLREGETSVHVVTGGETFNPDPYVFGEGRVQQRATFDYTLVLDTNDLSQVKSVGINEFELKVLGIKTA